MSAIHVRAYVVGFGDCILLRLPDGRDTRHVLVDFGRAPGDPASLERFPRIAQDIERVCNGRLDLLVATHEHLDHVEGFYRERAVFDRMDVEQVWMGLPSHPRYYHDFPRARLQRRLQDSLRAFAAHAARRGLALHPGFRSLLENNLSNRDRIDYLRRLGRRPVTYLARGKGVARPAAFRDIRIRVLAPEPDVSVYYTASARDRALTAALAHASDSHERGAVDPAWQFPRVPRARAGDLPGISRSDFERLRRAIREGGVAAARFIDRARNNTSLALLIEAGGKRLLLPGDAELESWAVMKRKCATDLGQPVDFLKVAHHGSHNGTPLDMLERLLPVRRRARARVLVSTKRDVYGRQNPVPDDALLRELTRRCRRLVTTDGRTGTHVDVEV